MYEIKKLDEAVLRAARQRWKMIAKPLGSLGVFEEMISQLAAMQGTLNVDISKRCVVVMCADNGVVAEGVTQAPSSVTAVVARNITLGEASVCQAAKYANTEVIPIDVGMAEDVANVTRKKMSYGTKNIFREKAMTYDEAKKMVETGIACVKTLSERGHKIIVTGEMGIGNTTTSSAVAGVLLDKDAAKVTGRGAGLDTEGLLRKIRVVDGAIKLHKPDKNDIIDVMSKVGGYDIAALTGVFIGGAMYKTAVVIDGFISAVAALCAERLSGGAADFMLASHVSKESCACEILEALGKKAPINAGMFPGEGAGGVMLMPLLDMALGVFRNMPVFEEINIEPYKELL